MNGAEPGAEPPPSCAKDTIAEAKAYCAANGLRFTDARRRVLELLLEAPRAIGAYELLEELKREKLGAQPPAVYRALDFLVAHGFAHKIDRLSAFVACSHPHEDHLPVYMVCTSCAAVTELCSNTPTNLLGPAAGQMGFELEETVVEGFGTCIDCKKADPPA